MSKPGPQFTLSAASINSDPSELDSTELSPETSSRRSEAVAMRSTAWIRRNRKSQIRAELGDKRKCDSTVIGNVPQEPSSTEFEDPAEGDQQKATSGAKNV
ncbi:hypothetical protein DOTSEDRAFT_24191 [Dothistroma septosporum NZE10]|uniref:Uncharacterized protein n=1 Tax=Dothistroma septosporum (strain NZE10 / CBS 128990) TaxID=675120 RepID=N1PNY4_DOTSN|nr:hypothetical protein DOTSEDRAFT_24191 [Dothistroma septosporum NZE10]